MTDEGRLAEASPKALLEISKGLLSLRAFRANASRDADKMAILYRVLNADLRQAYSTFETFSSFYGNGDLEEDYFNEFDAHVCSLLGTPMLNASLELQNKELAACALGMGAAVSMGQLVELEALGVDLVGSVFETRIGTCTLSPLMAKAGNLGVLRYLLDRGADLEAKDNKGKTALHWAARGGHAGVASLLLERGADLEAKQNYGKTALHIAVFGGHAEVASLLLERGAELEVKDDFGKTALDYAEERGHKNVANLLRAKIR